LLLFVISFRPAVIEQHDLWVGYDVVAGSGIETGPSLV
jgi:hypothetical protein